MSGYVGVETCSKRSCPTCGPRINAIRAGEIERALTLHHERGGGSVLWLRTIPTLGRGDGFTSQARRFRKAWRWMTGHSSYKALLRRYGVRHTIWGRDDTWSDSYEAAHHHRHGVYLVDRPVDEATRKAFERDAFEVWREACRRTGAGAPNPDANGFEAIRDAGALARYIARAVREVSRPDVKDGLAGLTPRQLRARFLATGDVGDLERVHDWEQSLLDRSCGASLYWSPGAKAEFGIGEKDDDDALREEVKGFTPETAHTFTDAEWRAVQSVPGRSGVLLVLTRTRGMSAVRDALVAWLSSPRGSPVGRCLVPVGVT